MLLWSVSSHHHFWEGLVLDFGLILYHAPRRVAAPQGHYTCANMTQLKGEVMRRRKGVDVEMNLVGGLGYLTSRMRRQVGGTGDASNREIGKRRGPASGK